jgi:hypothetical protein
LNFIGIGGLPNSDAIKIKSVKNTVPVITKLVVYHLKSVTGGPCVSRGLYVENLSLKFSSKRDIIFIRNVNVEDIRPAAY